MDLKQLEYFVCVAELGSFTRASLQLDIAQPALSRQVRQLEIELKRSLLVRNGRGASVTEAGQLLLDHARGILHQVARAKEDFGRTEAELAGRVVVGMPPTLARRLALGLTRHVRSAYPKASLGIVEGFSVSLQDALTQGRVDLALLYNPRPAAGVEVTTLAEEPLCLVSAPDPSQARAKITLRDLCKLPLVIPSRPNAFRMVLEHAMARQGHRANIVVEIDAVNAILALVKDGVGHALLPASAVQGRAERARWLVRQVAADSMTVQLCMASSAVRPMTRTQRAVQDWIMGHLRKAF